MTTDWLNYFFLIVIAIGVRKYVSYFLMPKYGSKIAIYPNPTTGYFPVEFDTNVNGIVAVNF
jgi:hypothetical protein